jgi:hypothetical protein
MEYSIKCHKKYAEKCRAGPASRAGRASRMKDNS